MPIRKTTQEFIENSVKIHGNKYNYSKCNYIGNKNKVCIICPTHGEFLQTPNDHIGGHKCSKCSLSEQRNYNLKEAYSDKNKNFPLDFYVLEIKNEEGLFLKVGISKNVDQRFKNIKVKSKGEINKLLIYPCTLQEATLLEDFIILDLKPKYQFDFKRKFSGYTECVSYNAKQEIINKIKDFTLAQNKSPLVGKILDYEYGK